MTLTAHRRLSRQAVRHAGRFPLIEPLEARIFLATHTWNGGAAGAWNVPGNWSGNAVPVAGDDVIFNNAGAVTVTLSTMVVGINSLVVKGHTQLTLDTTTGSQPFRAWHTFTTISLQQEDGDCTVVQGVFRTFFRVVASNG